ncbi:MAG: class I SAM-dependent methyltransferase [Acidobacteria bacterium]|nr:class I SAM-dependent methyltransferase [Acidobacteriota bacterium]
MAGSGSRGARPRALAPLTLASVLDRQVPATPWAEGDNLPWDDPDFSERMLAEHLSQQHDRASRRAATIDAQVRFLARQVAGGDGARVLDLACGPGLYLHRLARLGYRCHGIDFSPAAIRHARSVAAAEALDCTFDQADLRQADLGRGYAMVLLVYGQVNVFPRPVARDILSRAHAALVPGGTLVLEPQTPEAVRATGHGDATWASARSGLFAAGPHLLLEERFWDAPSRTATERWHVVHAETARVERYAMSTCSYDARELVDLLAAIGFAEVRTHPSLTDDDGPAAPGLFGMTAVR